MATINLPEIHSFQSALKRYRSFQKIRYWAPKAIILGVMLIPILFMVLSSSPRSSRSTKSESQLITIPFLLILGGVSALVHVSNNKNNLRESIVKTWLQGDSNKFIEIENDIDKFLSTLPGESKESINSRNSQTLKLRLKMFGFVMGVIALFLLTLGFLEWVGGK